MYNPVVVNSVTNSNYKNPIGGKKDLALHIQRSFFANIPNYVTDTIRVCYSNHSQSESCTSGCTPRNLSKFNFNYFYLSDKTYFFFLSHLLLSTDPFTNQENKNSILEFLFSVKPLKISLRAETKGITLNFDNDTMTEINRKLLAKYKGDLKIPAMPLAFRENCSNKLIKRMTDEDKILRDVKKEVEEGRPLGRFGAYLKTFQRDIRIKKGLIFNDNKLIVPAALRSSFMSLLHENHPGQFGMKSLAESIWRTHL